MNPPLLPGSSFLHPARIAGALALALLSNAIAEDSPEEQRWQNYELRRKVSYEAYGRDALKNRRVISQYGFADYVSIFPIEGLPEQLKGKEGEVSLVPDPKDHGSGKIAVYLLNATNRPLPGAVAFRLDCFLEVNDGDRWRACESFIPGCGTGSFKPRPLEAGHGLVFTATHPEIGDMTGELRYCVAIAGSRPIVSAPFHGRFSSKRFEEANPAGLGWRQVERSQGRRPWKHRPGPRRMARCRGARP